MIYGERDRIRRVFFDAWRKHAAGEALEPLERALVTVIEAHPEYHTLLSDPAAIGRDFPIEGEESSGEVNPFLHLGMHITIVEQITSDRPAGIRACYDRLRARFSDAHQLEHAMMQCLADVLRRSRESGAPPDERRYLACVHRLERRVL